MGEGIGDVGVMGSLALPDLRPAWQSLRVSSGAGSQKKLAFAVGWFPHRNPSKHGLRASCGRLTEGLIAVFGKASCSAYRDLFW